MEPAGFLISNDVESTKRHRVSTNKQQTQQQQQPTTKLASSSSPLMPKNNNNTVTNGTSMGMGATLTANIVASINDQGLRTHDFVMRRRKPTGQQVPGHKGNYNNNNNNKTRNKAKGTSMNGEEIDYNDDIGAALTLATMHMLPLPRKRKTEEKEEKEKRLHMYNPPAAAPHVLRKEASPLVMVYKGAPLLEREECHDGRDKGEGEGGVATGGGFQLLQQREVIKSTVVGAHPDKLPFIGSLYDEQYLQNICNAARSLKMSSELQNAVLKRVLERQAEAEQK